MRHSAKRTLAVVLSAAAALSLTACGGGNKAAEGGSGSAAPAGSQAEGSAQAGGDVVRIASKADIATMDPQNQNDIISGLAIRSVYETLVRLNPETNEFEPYLAESYDYVEGSDKDLAFKLHEGIKFHNGADLTAEDVKFSLDRQKSSGYVGHLVELIDSVEVVDDYNFIIHLSEPTSTIISSLSHMGSSIMDKETTEKMDAEGKSLDEAPNGTGPFVFDKWTLGSEWSLKKNENYWNDDFKAQCDQIISKVIPEETGRTVALQTGEIDVLFDVPKVDISNIEADPNLDLVTYDSTSLDFIGLNCSKAPFDNKALREAVAYCINRDDIIQVQYMGQAIPCFTCIGPSALGYTDDVEKHERDIEKAKEKLAEAGMPNGFSFTISTTSTDRARACEVIQAACKEAGIQVNIEILEKAAYNDKIGKGAHEAAYAGWIANAEPDNTYRPLFSSATIAKGGSNSACFKSDEIDQLLAEGASATDDAVKLEKYQEIAKVVSRECAVVPVCSEKGQIAKTKNVDGLIPSSIRLHDLFGLHHVK